MQRRETALQQQVLDLRSQLDAAAEPSPSAKNRRGAFKGGVCPLGLSICIGAGVCVCGEWEARLERAELQVSLKEQRG